MLLLLLLLLLPPVPPSPPSSDANMSENALASFSWRALTGEMVSSSVGERAGKEDMARRAPELREAIVVLKP